MPSQTRLKAFSIVCWILLMVILSYNLHSKYQSISACESQLVRLDLLEAQIENTKK